jgi:hypothetical protein
LDAIQALAPRRPGRTVFSPREGAGTYRPDARRGECPSVPPGGRPRPIHSGLDPPVLRPVGEPHNNVAASGREAATSDRTDPAPRRRSGGRAVAFLPAALPGGCFAASRQTKEGALPAPVVDRVEAIPDPAPHLAEKAPALRVRRNRRCSDQAHDLIFMRTFSTSGRKSPRGRWAANLNTPSDASHRRLGAG